ncbi:hypothetical protein B0T14DRAFT_565117 [Immersiella caudata]|uniref:Uncharacterized protein n=1 Tax=Immersiella caudata TaxID=314043 RepID=A0AA40C3V1_9PEZI|nr:hypothetical protein B0T14DRAFT_565117 [Immersiella caudata]
MGRNYAPAALRWWFLGLIFLYTCFVLTFLEYALQSLPLVDDPRIIGIEKSSRAPLPTTADTPPTAFPPVPTRFITPLVPNRRAPSIERQTNSSSAEPFLNTTVPAASPTANQDVSHPKTGLGLAVPLRILHKSPNKYPQLDPNTVIAHCRIVSKWMHGPNGRDIIPVPSGMDISTRCIMHAMGLYFSENPDDCAANFQYSEPRRIDPDFGMTFTTVVFHSEECFKAWSDLSRKLNFTAKDDCFLEESRQGKILQPAKSQGPLGISHINSSGEPSTTNDLVWPGDAQNYYYARGTVITRTDSRGQPVATETVVPGWDMPLSTTRSTTTITGTDGRPLTTIITTLTTPVSQQLTAVTTTLYSSGTPYATATVYGIPYPSTLANHTAWSEPPTSAIQVVPMTAFLYFLASFSPVMITTLLGILIQTLHRSTLSMAPFRALSRPVGATARDSILLTADGALPWSAAGLAWRLRDPLLVLSGLLFFLSAVLVAISSEAVGLALRGGCEKKDGFQGCFMSPAVIRKPARAAEGVLVAMIVLIGGMGIYLCRWKIGVGEDPRSIAGVVKLMHVGFDEKEKNHGLRGLLIGLDTPTRDERISKREMRERFAERRFAIRTPEEGIVVLGDDARVRTPSGLTKKWYSYRSCLTRLGRCWKLGNNYRSHVLRGYTFQILFLLSLCGLLAVVAHYGSEELHPENPLERFMDSQTVGVTLLFTAVGVVIDMFWDSFFCWNEMLEPYRCLSGKRTRNRTDLARPRSSNVFSGLFRAVVHKDAFLGALAFAGVLAKCLPICLANIPFSLTTTWDTFVACTWTTVAILAFMITVLAVSFFLPQPYMPVDPSSAVGCLYYVCDSRLLDHVESRSLGGGIGMVGETGATYRFGIMTGTSGKRRIGIEFNE